MSAFTDGEAADARPLEALSFDLLRALLAARQGASPTVRALGAARPRTENSERGARVALFSGAASVAAMGEHSGAFRAPRADDMVPGQGERHV